MNKLPDELIHQLRYETYEAEAKGALTEKQLQIIYENRWFDLFVPVAYGGLGLSLPEAVRLEEQLAAIDGSLGWVVTLCAGANMFIGYLDEGLRKKIFTNDRAGICFAGSGRPNGIATPDLDGYLITGNWPYASGAPHATHFTANCKIGEEIWSFIFTRDEVTIKQDWNYLGLNATAGHSFSVENLRVPAERRFLISASTVKLPDPIYSYPFQQLAASTIAINIVGMCSYFLQLVEDIFKEQFGEILTCEAEKKLIPEFQTERAEELITHAKSELEVLRKTFYKALDQSWESHIHNVADSTQLGRLSCESKRLARRSRELVAEIYPCCGMQAARMDTILNQVWRNIHTASQHKALC